MTWVGLQRSRIAVCSGSSKLSWREQTTIYLSFGRVIQSQ